MAAEKAVRDLTAYRVLKFPQKPDQNSANSVTNGYQDVGGVKASNSGAAIRTIAEKAGAGTYVAVPESTWNPVTVTVETQTVIRLNDTPAPT